MTEGRNFSSIISFAFDADEIARAISRKPGPYWDTGVTA
jgi:hypothetical protein